MKRNVFENSSMTHKELCEYIEKHVICFDDGSGTTYNITDEEYTINDDMSVILWADNITINTNNKPIPLIIASADLIHFGEDFSFNNVNCLPKKCKSLNFTDCLVQKKNVVIDSDVSYEIDIDYLDREVAFESLTFKSKLNKLHRLDISRTTIKTLAFDIPSIYSVYLTACNTNIFNNIHFNNIEAFYCYDCSVTSIYDMHKLNDKIKRQFRTDIEDVVSFRGIENSKISNINLHKCDTLNNIILCLLNDTSTIEIMPLNFSGSCSKGIIIIDKYLEVKRLRKEYLMDCVIELIDAGFEEAAEI